MNRLHGLLISFFIVFSTPGGVLAASDDGEKLKPGDPAPAFLVKDLKGKKHMLRPVTLVPGRKPPPQPVFLIDFFATWCKPCRKLLPGIIKMQKAWKHAGLQVLLVDYTEDRETLTKFVEEEGIQLSAVFDIRGRFMANRFGVKEMPTTILIGRDFNIVLYMDGETKDKEAVLNNTLRKLLGPPKLAKKKKTVAES